MQIDSLKKRLICNYSLLTSVEGLESSTLTLVTSAGTIIGTPVIDNTEDDNIELYENANDEICKRYREDNYINDNKPLPGNDGFIELKIKAGYLYLKYPAFIFILTN